MGTIYTHLRGRPRPAGLKKMFIVNFLLILVGAFIATCIAEWFMLVLLREISATFKYVNALFLLLGVLGTPPFIFLGLAALVFAYRAERAISQPVHELNLAVEKIRQQDLNFHIQYDKANELGNLCRALNTLRGELQASLEREWTRQEETRLMVAALAHDLRTPVTIIQGHVEGLARPGPRRMERLESYLPALESCSQRMIKLLNDILLLDSLEQTDLLIQPQPILLKKELERKAQLYEIQASEHQIHFQITLQPGQQSVMLDLHRLEQLMDNLFENALRHTPAGGSIYLDCMWESKLVVSVRDTGEGIADEDLPHIFEKFYHGKKHKRGSEYASGLGLCICKVLAEKQGGSIAITNHSAGGCLATFTIPLQKPLS